MTLDNLLNTFINSTASEWNGISCWGANGGPSYKNQFSFWDAYNGSTNVLTHREHSNVASYKPDLSITIAWGIEIGDPERDKVDLPWAKNNPDPSPGISYYLDFFYNGALVFRTSYCVIDGGRSAIPFPYYNGGNINNPVVPQRYFDAIKKFNEIANMGNFGVYFEGTGIKIVDEDWPR